MADSKEKIRVKIHFDVIDKNTGQCVREETRDGFLITNKTTEEHYEKCERNFNSDCKLGSNGGSPGYDHTL